MVVGVGRTDICISSCVLFKPEIGWLFMLFLYQRSLRFNLVDVSHKRESEVTIKVQLFLGIFDEPFLFPWIWVLLKTSEVQDTSLNSWTLLHYAGVATKISITDNHHGRSFTWRGQMLNSFRPTCFFSVTSPFIARCQFFCFECLMRLVGKVSVWGQDPVTQIWCSILLFHSKYTIEGGLTSRYLVKQQWIFGLLPPNGDEKKGADIVEVRGSGWSHEDPSWQFCHLTEGLAGEWPKVEKHLKIGALEIRDIIESNPGIFFR